MISRCVVAILMFAGTGLSQSVDSARMDQIAQSYVSAKQFMGSVLVARGGDVLLSKGYGFANVDWEMSNTPSIKFRLGSLTKQFTAASILLLEEHGKLNVEDPVKKYLPDAPAAWNKMTIFHVLTHTAGIPDFTNFPDYLSSEPFVTTPEKLVARFRDKPLEFEPGERMSYSNSGYVLLGYLIERISGQTYESFLQENIFTPLGMKDSGYESNSAIVARHATGYVPSSNGPVNARFVHMSVLFAAGGLYSTTEDLLKWEQGLFGGKLLSARSLQKMTTPFKNDYAFGLSVARVGGRTWVTHNGRIEGFTTLLAYYPEDKLTVVVLGNLNSSAPQEIGFRLGAVAEGDTVTLQSERKEITLDPKALSRFVGAYELPSGVRMMVTLTGSQLMRKLGSQQAAPIFPESETKFFLKIIDAQLEFSGNDSEGRPAVALLHQNGEDITAKRVDDAEFKRLVDAEAAFQKHFKEQTAAPGSEAAVRRIIEELRSGKPNYDAMSSNVAVSIRQQLSQLQSELRERGATQSITFKGVGPGGADIYEIKFEHGSWDYRIWLTLDGKIDNAVVRPLN